jgi:DNA-binding transcriptional LysR family regulator
MVLRTDVIPSELLRSFMTIQRTGSYTDAAEVLGLSQPAISSHMKRLQHMVGGELFERRTGGLHLTARGETVKDYATRILNLNSQMLRLCGAGERKRTLRVGIQNVFAPTHLARLQRSLESGLPEQRSIVTWSMGKELLDNVRAGYLDAAFVVRPVGSDDQLDDQWDEEMSWVCSSGFVLGEGRPIPLLSWPDSVSDSLLVAALSRAGASYSFVMVGSDLSTHLAAARAGIGLFTLPRRLVPADLRIADFHYLPRLPRARCGVSVNEAISPADADLLRDVIGDAMRPDASVLVETEARTAHAAFG